MASAINTGFHVNPSKGIKRKTPESQKFDDEFWVIGGYDGGFQERDSVMIFNPEDRLWRHGKQMNFERDHHSVAVDGNQIFAFSGAGVETSARVFDLKTQAWNSIPTMKEEVRLGKFTFKRGAGVVTINQQTYFCGGYNAGQRVIKYDHLDETWSNCPNMICSRARPAIVEYRAVIYAIGGCDENDKSAEKFENGVWELIPEMVNGRWGAAAITLDGLIYVAGGWEQSSVEAFDPSTNSWKTVKPMTEMRFCFGFNSFHNQLIAFGGNNGNQRLNSVEIYNRMEDAWTISTPMPENRSHLGVLKILIQ